MKPEVTPHVALAVDDLEAAAEYYAESFGWERGRGTDHWIEMKSGPLHFYLCRDEDSSPCFAIDVDDLEVAKGHFTGQGCVIVREEGGEAFVRDRYGYHFCLSPRSS